MSAFKSYKTDAWEDPEINKRYEADAWTDCEFAKRYISGAWEEVWTAMKWFTEHSNNITNAMLQIQDDGLEMQIWKFMDGSEEGSLAGGGTIVFVLEGEWTNPTIEFEWQGEMFRFSANNTTWYTDSAGSISLYRGKSDGTSDTVTAVSSVGQSRSGVEGTDSIPNTPSGTYSTQLTGTYNKLGLSIYVRGWSGTYYRASSDIFVMNVKIDGKKVAFPLSSEFDNLDW